jgi:iron complex outermembrane receptor protein
MKQRGLTLAIQRIVWAELALTAACGVPAYAQSQAAATADAVSATTTTPATASSAPPPAGRANPPAGTTATPATASPSGNVAQLQKFEVTGSLIRSSDKTGYNQVQTISQKDIENSGATTVSDYLRSTRANSASSWREGTSASFAPGGAGLILRGMSENTHWC